MRIFVLIFCSINLLSAQNIVQKSFVNSEIEVISIDAKNSFELSVETTQGSEMLIEADIDGEYKNDLLLNVRQSSESLMVSTGFQPNFKMPNDKLGAHKVVSVALKILVPEQKSVTIFGTDCNVSAKGIYRNLKISLNDGSCILGKVFGNATVATQSGSISVVTTRAEIKAKSKYGEVRGDRIPLGDNRYRLSSVTGDIILKGME